MLGDIPSYTVLDSAVWLQLFRGITYPYPSADEGARVFYEVLLPFLAQQPLPAAIALHPPPHGATLEHQRAVHAPSWASPSHPSKYTVHRRNLSSSPCRHKLATTCTRQTRYPCPAEVLICGPCHAACRRVRSPNDDPTRTCAALECVCGLLLMGTVTPADAKLVELQLCWQLVRSCSVQLLATSKLPQVRRRRWQEVHATGRPKRDCGVRGGAGPRHARRR